MPVPSGILNTSRVLNSDPKKRDKSPPSSSSSSSLLLYRTSPIQKIFILGLSIYIPLSFVFIFESPFVAIPTISDDKIYQVPNEQNNLIFGKGRKHNKDDKLNNYVITRIRPQDLLRPTPIIVMGLPKAGTTSVGKYFECGFTKEYQYRVSHYDCHEQRGELENQIHGGGRPCGIIMYNNKVSTEELSSIFDTIDHFDVYSEIDMIQDRSIILPQVRFITQIYDAYPNATWILNLRDPKDWLKSINRAGLRAKFVNSRIFHRSLGEMKKAGIGEKDEDMIQFYKTQADFVRKFVRSHPSIHLVELDISQDNAGLKMEQTFGISEKCWGEKNKASQ